MCGLFPVLERNGIQDTHFLHGDAEGHDCEVLKDLELSLNMVPSRSLLEHKIGSQQKTQTLQFLRKDGHSVCDCWVDYLAINQNLAKGLAGAGALARRRRTGGTKLIVQTGS
jgi:hypothetical protein